MKLRRFAVLAIALLLGGYSHVSAQGGTDDDPRWKAAESLRMKMKDAKTDGAIATKIAGLLLGMGTVGVEALVDVVDTAAADKRKRIGMGVFYDFEEEPGLAYKALGNSLRIEEGGR